jgi:outer membrane lipoprotein-sorting protein
MSSNPLWAAPGVMDILKKMDEIENLGADITVKVDITETKVNQGILLMEGVYYRRDRDDAYLIVMTSPDAQKGNGYLRVGDNMWMYRRNTRTFQMMNRSQSIEGTNADGADLETRKYVDLYEPVLDDRGKDMLTEETLGKAKIPVYRFEVHAKVKDVDYPKKVYWVRQDNFLRLKEESYSLSGTLAETAYYPQYTQVEGRYIPVKQLFIDEFEKGNKTLLELSGISLASIDNSVFTKAYLENLSK